MGKQSANPANGEPHDLPHFPHKTAVSVLPDHVMVLLTRYVKFTMIRFLCYEGVVFQGVTVTQDSNITAVESYFESRPSLTNSTGHHNTWMGV